MPIGSGVRAQCGFAVETVKNTRQVPNRFLGFVQEGIQGGPEQIKSRALRAGRLLPHRVVGGRRMWGGPINLELQAETIGSLLRACIDGTPVTSGAGPFTHTYTPDDLSSLTVQIGRPDTASTVRPYDYVGCMVESWSITVDPSQTYTQFQVSVQAFDELLNQTLAVATYTPPTPLLFTQASLTVAASELCFDTLTINADNGLETDLFKVCAASAGRRTIREAGQRVYGGTLTADYDAQTHAEYVKFLAGTEASLSLVWNAGPSAQLTMAGNVRYSGTTPNVAGPEVLKSELPFEFVSGTSDAAAFTATLITTDATV